MGRKRERFQFLTSEVMTGTSVITSPGLDTNELGCFSMELSWTGTPNGAFVLQCSVSGDNWADVSLSPAIGAAVGSADSRLIQYTDFQFPLVRIKYTNTSGTGALTGWFYSKGMA